MSASESLFRHGEFDVVVSRKVGRWHLGRRSTDGVERVYRWIRYVGYVRAPRRISPWKV